ncbi:hypothetical protein DFS34DRAFT_591608 [Phlyctochytrium arcticum]|nr:hypothetical protein DFS34DRAFT_591608 [Phlyctochytrium arcticum]
MNWCRYVGISFEDFWAWNRQKDSSVARYKRWFEQWQSKKEYHVSSQLLDVLLRRSYPRISESKLTENMRKQFTIDMEHIAEGENGGFYNWKEISPPKKTTVGKKEATGITENFKASEDATDDENKRRRNIHFSLVQWEQGKLKVW